MCSGNSLYYLMTVCVYVLSVYTFLLWYLQRLHSFFFFFFFPFLWVWIHKTSLRPPLIEIPVPRHASERSCICVVHYIVSLTQDNLYITWYMCVGYCVTERLYNIYMYLDIVCPWAIYNIYICIIYFNSCDCIMNSSLSYTIY